MLTLFKTLISQRLSHQLSSNKLSVIMIGKFEFNHFTYLVKFACLGKKLLIFKEKVYFFPVRGSILFNYEKTFTPQHQKPNYIILDSTHIICFDKKNILF